MDFSCSEQILLLHKLLVSEIFCMGLVHRDSVIALCFEFFQPRVKNICYQECQEINRERKGFCKNFFFSPHIALKKGNYGWDTAINT